MDPHLPQTLRETLDAEAVERAVVRARMWAHFQLSPKGPREARKIFCLGPAKTATSSLHAMFVENGLRSLHSSGDWQVARFDAFSDRGDYRPFRAYAATYPNAVFVLNTRGLRGYLSSYATHLQRKVPELGRKPLPVQYFINRILRRNHHMAEVLRHFAGADRLIVANIDRPGAIDFVAQRLGLAPSSQPHRHRTKRAPFAENEANIDAALAALGIGDQGSEPLVLDTLLTVAERRAAAMPTAANLFL